MNLHSPTAETRSARRGADVSTVPTMHSAYCYAGDHLSKLHSLVIKDGQHCQSSPASHMARTATRVRKQIWWRSFQQLPMQDR
jgi:hypothetical protein